MPDNVSDGSLQFCNASIATLIVDESNDEDANPIRNQDTTGEDSSERTANVVGAQAKAKEFLVHGKLLCGASPVLKAAFQGHFAEARNKSMTIKDLGASMINEFVSWLYRGKRLPEPPNIEAAAQLWYLNVARLAVVADIYQIDGLGEEVIEALVKASSLKVPHGQ